MNDTELQSLEKMLRLAYPEKTIVDIAELENEEHQTYKYLYEQLIQERDGLTEETFHLRFQLEDREREIFNLKGELQVERSVNEKLNETTMNVLEFIEMFSKQEIVVSDIKVYEKNGDEIGENEELKGSLKNSISTNPGIYGGKRPSWFTPLKNELSKENVAKKAASNTQGVLKENLCFWKRIKRSLQRKEITVADAMSEYDIKRKMKVMELLKSDGNNYEKYLKYFLLTPGLPKDFMNTLVGAAELNLDANVIIELLEQPAESFNREIIEIYVSETHKGTEFNVKKELANELIRGEWYVTADVNGTQHKFQMAPLELLEEINGKLNNICSILSNLADEKLCANLAQSFSDVHKDEKELDVYDSSEVQNTFVEFDDSDLLN